MPNNYIKDIIKVLGVELGEKFYIDGIGLNNVQFCITPIGLQLANHTNQSLTCNDILGYLIAGKGTIRKCVSDKQTGIDDIKCGHVVYPLFDQEFRASKDSDYITNPQNFTSLNICLNWEKYITIKKQLAKIASELNDKPLNWYSTSQEKWTIVYLTSNETLEPRMIQKTFAYTGDTGNILSDQICFTSKEACNVAINTVGKDNLIWLLRDFQPYLNYSWGDKDSMDTYIN